MHCTAHNGFLWQLNWLIIYGQKKKELIDYIWPKKKLIDYIGLREVQQLGEVEWMVSVKDDAMLCLKYMAKGGDATFTIYLWRNLTFIHTTIEILQPQKKHPYQEQKKIW